MTGMRRTEAFRNYEAFALVTGAASGMGREYARSLAGMGYSLYRIAVTNDVNERDPGEFNQFGEWIALANLGIVSVYRNSFFRFYASCSYSILTSGIPIRFGVGAGGGFIF